jgi:hypothetical protein
MSRTDKLFRAIVVMGAAITAPACVDSKCARCVPPADAVATTDAPTDAGPTDTPVDMVLIL